MESSIDTPNSSIKDFTCVARIQEIQDEANGRSTGWVEGVGEGSVVSTKRWSQSSQRVDQ